MIKTTWSPPSVKQSSTISQRASKEWIVSKLHSSLINCQLLRCLFWLSWPGPLAKDTLETRRTSSEKLSFRALICPFNLWALVDISILSLEFISFDDISFEILLTLKSSWFNSSPFQHIPRHCLTRLLWSPSHYYVASWVSWTHNIYSA